MKMNYHLKSSRKQNSQYLFSFYILLGAAIVIFAANAIFPSFFPKFFTLIAYPLWKGEEAAMVGGERIFMSKKDLAEENRQLRAKLMELEEKTVYAVQIERENTELKEILHRTSAKNALLAVILEKPPRTPYDTLIIDVGEKENITVGSKVTIGGNILIGQVAEVNGPTSKVRLYSTAGEKVDVRIGPSHIDTVATGRGHGDYEATLPREVKIAVGDHVVAPAITPLVFGNVVSIISDPASPFEKILFQVPFNLAELNFVEVLRN
jgi:cell shape-determining protein MreC